MAATGTRSGRELSSDRKRLDRGKRGVSRYCLTSDLWATLPESLVEEILSKLPFSTLLRLCRVCKRWRQLILSSEISPRCTSRHGHLFYFLHGKLTAFNSNRGTWEIIPLEFLQAEVTLVGVVASSGAFLCFSTPAVGEFIVCNPLTKRYKRLQLPYGEASTTSDQPDWPNPVHAYRNQGLLVGMVLDLHDGHFKLVVAGLCRGSGVETVVYDSRANFWKKVADMPQDGYDWRIHRDPPKLIACGGNLYVDFREATNRCNGRPNRLLKYDVDQEAWSWIVLPWFDGYKHNVTEFNGKLLLLIGRFNNQLIAILSVFELKEGGESMSLLPTDRLPLSRVRGAMGCMSGIQCYGQGDVMFFVKRWVAEGPCFIGGPLVTRTCVGEWYHNDVPNSEELSGWEEYKEDEYIHDFQIFKPSLLGVN